MNNQNYADASVKTAADLKTVATSPNIAELSRLSLPEIQQLSDQIAQVVPAGNIPGLILSGLTRIEGRQVGTAERQRHLNLLFKGVRDLLDKAVYGAMFAGPAAVIMAYQRLLQLAGKDVETAFPEGTWQFYLHFALREDSARHANETIGFQQRISHHHIVLEEAEALAAWLMSCVNTLSNYDRLLENEWRERIYTTLLDQVTAAFSVSAEIQAKIRNAYSEWEQERPYQRGHDAANLDYPAYRQQKFNHYLQQLLMLLPAQLQEAFAIEISRAEQTTLPAYLQQMTILAQLKPGEYQDNKVFYSLAETSVAVVCRGQYYFLPIIDPMTNEPVNYELIRRFAASVLMHPVRQSPSEADLHFVSALRAAQTGEPTNGLRAVDNVGRQLVAQFATVPVIVNWDKQIAQQPLATIRQNHRGIGDHALTLFFTDESTVFDQSHIFFDGAWGAALAEIMTNEALSWALYFSQLPAGQPTQSITPFSAPASLKLRQEAKKVRLPVEACAENQLIRLGQVLTLRRLFKTRNDLVNVTVNDLLILYRSVHGQRYKPGIALRRQLELLAQDSRSGCRQAYQLILDAIEKVQRNNPSILIPMDASQHSPHERLYPTTFRNPMNDLLQLHEATLAALDNYKQAQGDRTTPYSIFDERQRQYLRMIAGFGELMRKYKDIGLSGQSTSTTAIKMLAHMPDAVQRLLDQIPGRFDILNEVIKGEEVFSNVGRVANGSSLRRFITAKDDNQQKTLAWGVVTDDTNTVHISLRDFRPHITLLHQLSEQFSDPTFVQIANLITQDLLDSYVQGFNLFIQELREITVASRETRSHGIQTEKD